MCSVKAQNGQTFEHTHGDHGAQKAKRSSGGAQSGLHLPRGGPVRRLAACEEGCSGVASREETDSMARLCGAPGGHIRRRQRSRTEEPSPPSGGRPTCAVRGQKNSAPGTVCEMPGAQCHLPEGWRNGILKISRGRGGRLFSCLYHTSRRRICHPTAPQRAETDGRKGLYQE